MGTEVTLTTTGLSALLGVMLTAGFALGYQFKAWRIEWLKRRRERLMRQLQATDAQIGVLSKTA